MKHEIPFNAREQPLGLGQQSQPSGGLEFPNVEALLRHDALHTPVPPRIARRLEESLEQLPPPRRSWWQWLFGR
jgi:hypothetical protein